MTKLTLFATAAALLALPALAQSLGGNLPLRTFPHSIGGNLPLRTFEMAGGPNGSGGGCPCGANAAGHGYNPPGSDGGANTLNAGHGTDAYSGADGGGNALGSGAGSYGGNGDPGIGGGGASGAGGLGGAVD
jgi:hypothetical protein